jgi:hypothetical protein
MRMPTPHSANRTLLPPQSCLSWVAPRYGVSLSRCITIIRACKLHCWCRWPPCKYLPMCLAPSVCTTWNRLTSAIKGGEVLYSGSVYWRRRAHTQPFSSSWRVKADSNVVVWWIYTADNPAESLCSWHSCQLNSLSLKSIKASTWRELGSVRLRSSPGKYA